MSKTVYVIGAGFSKGLNAPIQSELVKGIFDLNVDDLQDNERVIFIEFKEEFQKFLTDVFFISKDKFGDIALEDIYTPLDRCILDNSSFRTLTKGEVQEIR
jgi:hypothetical protein